MGRKSKGVQAAYSPPPSQVGPTLRLTQPLLSRLQVYQYGPGLAPNAWTHWGIVLLAGLLVREQAPCQTAPGKP